MKINIKQVPVLGHETVMCDATTVRSHSGTVISRYDIQILSVHISDRLSWWVMA